MSSRSLPRTPRLATAPLGVVVAGLVGLSACAAPGAGSGASSASGTAGSAPSLVLADSREQGKYNPISGYGRYGNSPIYDGLLQMRSAGADAVAELVPNLAAEQPAVAADGLTWTVKLRDGVTFSNGSPFDATDVAATFNAVLDPKSASTITADFAMLAKAEAVDPGTVHFTLKHPYAEFDSRLLLGIAPSEAFTGGPAADMALNKAPIGTGRYVLKELNATQSILEPRSGVAAPYSKITVITVADDNTRAQRMSAGEIDGTTLPPALSATFDNKEGFKVARANTIDFRGIALPSTNPFTKETVARRAMNMAVDRQTIIDKVLMGHGKPAHTPVPAQLGDVYEPTATFPHDLAAAQRMLDEAGWVAGPDGIRAKAGNRASFKLMYSAADTLRRDLAVAFAADMKKLGVEAVLEGTTWDKIETQLTQAGLVLGGGHYPNSTDSLVYYPLHRRTPATSSPYSNPGNFGSDAMDALLENARKEQDKTRRRSLYRDVQKAYVADPPYVYIAFLTHDYVTRDSVPGLDTTLIVEPHVHDPLWGPFWNVGLR